MKSKNIIYRILVIAVLSGCKNSMEDSLINKVTQECSRQTRSACTIALKDVTKFKWDKMYIFPDWTTSESIAKTVGFNYGGNDVQDDYSRMLFTYGNKVIYEEDFKSLDYNKSTINFPEVSDSLNDTKSHYFTPSDAIFTEEKDKTKNGCEECFDYSFMSVKK